MAIDPTNKPPSPRYSWTHTPVGIANSNIKINLIRIIWALRFAGICGTKLEKENFPISYRLIKNMRTR